MQSFVYAEQCVQHLAEKVLNNVHIFSTLWFSKLFTDYIYMIIF